MIARTRMAASGTDPDRAIPSRSLHRDDNGTAPTAVPEDPRIWLARRGNPISLLAAARSRSAPTPRAPRARRGQQRYRRTGEPNTGTHTHRYHLFPPTRRFSVLSDTVPVRPIPSGSLHGDESGPAPRGVRKDPGIWRAGGSNPIPLLAAASSRSATTAGALRAGCGKQRYR